MVRVKQCNALWSDGNTNVCVSVCVFVCGQSVCIPPCADPAQNDSDTHNVLGGSLIITCLWVAFRLTVLQNPNSLVFYCVDICSRERASIQASIWLCCFCRSMTWRRFCMKCSYSEGGEATCVLQQGGNVLPGKGEWLSSKVIILFHLIIAWPFPMMRSYK